MKKVYPSPGQRMSVTGVGIRTFPRKSRDSVWPVDLFHDLSRPTFQIKALNDDEFSDSNFSPIDLEKAQSPQSCNKEEVESAKIKSDCADSNLLPQVEELLVTKKDKNNELMERNA